MTLRNETTDTNDRDSTPPPSGPLPGRLSLEERVRRSEALERASRQRDAHALDKTTWTKAWKRKDEYLAELIARLTREAGTGVDEGQQLTIEGTDTPPLPPIEVLSGRWAELVKISPPRIAAWTLQEADLSPVAKKLLERLKPKETLGRPASVTLETGDLPELLGCTAAEALDAVAELLCVELATLRGGKNLSASGAKEGLLRLDGWRDDGEEVGLDVLHEMLRTELDDVHPDYLLLGAKLPRRALLPLLEGLKAIGAVTSTEKGWKRVARVPLWEKLVLEALARAEGVGYQAERALTGCLDFDWTIGGLVEAGVIKRGSKSEVSGQAWELVPEADRQPLSLEDVVAMVRRNAPKEGSKVAAPVQRIAYDLDLQGPTVRRACEALVAEGWLVEAPEDKQNWNNYYGPWYARAKVEKKAKGKKGKAEKKTPAKPATTTATAKPTRNLRQEARKRSKKAAAAATATPAMTEAQKRTKPLFSDVKPAPASSEPEEEASEP